MDSGLEISRQIQRNELRQANNFNNPTLYRIGNKIAETGLYQVLGMQNEVIGYGQIIFKLPYVYGDIVRATKPYGSDLWTLDRPDKNAPASPDTNQPESPDTPPDQPESPENPPPPSPSPTNGSPTNPPSSTPPVTTSKPPKPPRSPISCEPPVKGCTWQDAAIPCNGKIQDFDYVRLNTGTLILCCDPSVTPPSNGGCSPVRFSCKNGVCYPSATGTATLAECQAALIPPPFTGGQISGRTYVVDAAWTFTINGIQSDEQSTSNLRTGAIGYPYTRDDDPEVKILEYIAGGAVITLDARSKVDFFGAPQTVVFNVTNFTVTPVDDLPDKDPPPTCP